MKIFSVGDMLTAPVLNSTMWSFSTYRASFSGITRGSGHTTVTRYCRLGHGNLVFFTGHITFGTSPSITAEATVTFPGNVSTSDSDLVDRVQWCTGSWVFRDSGGPYHYAGSLGVWNTSGAEFSFGGAWNGTALKKRIDTGIPVTVASTDSLSWQGYYISTR